MNTCVVTLGYGQPPGLPWVRTGFKTGPRLQTSIILSILSRSTLHAALLHAGRQKNDRSLRIGVQAGYLAQRHSEGVRQGYIRHSQGWHSALVLSVWRSEGLARVVPCAL